MKMAPTDLDAITAAISSRLILDAAEVLTLTNSPPGRERKLAERVVEFGSDHIPEARWSVDEYGEQAGSVMALAETGAAARHLGFYAHLDTSLTGDGSLDLAVTGTDAAVPPLRKSDDGEKLIGFGLSVSKAPAAAAIAALAATARILADAGKAHRVSLMLAGGGTHRADPPGTPLVAGVGRIPGFGAGVRHGLASGYTPDAVVNVKAGAPGVLFEEPGCMFVRIAVRRSMVPALLRERLDPEGGITSLSGPLLTAIDSWRNAFVAETPQGTQTRREAAVGAIRSGSFSKPDLLPALLEVSVYVVLALGDDPDAVAADLESHVTEETGLDLEVEVYAAEPGAGTPEDAPIVAIARQVWDSRFGPGSHELRDWTGATDGVVFRSHGIDTVRLGIQTSQDETDPRLDVVAIDSLLTFAGMYAEIAVRYAIEGSDR